MMDLGVYVVDLVDQFEVEFCIMVEVVIYL